MPRKIRELRADLRRAGFGEVRGRGKGSHRRYQHPDAPEAGVILAGNDGDDAQPYKEKQVREAIARVRAVQVEQARQRRRS
jgi:predicted RNA binding protein YcfA (HicA-like mRNA interferase family)